MMMPEIIKLRRELHQHPERSGDEVETAQRIRSFIHAHHPTKIIDHIGGNGLAVVYEFATSGPSIAIRCELDALPIQEVNQFAHRSIVEGIAHKCGHDGHMAIVAGLIFWIKAQAFKSGKIILLFQPAEETGRGARKVLADKRFKALKIDYIFALHNIPGEPTHSIISTKSGFSAEVQSFAITLKGKESHASEPEHGINPAAGIAELISAISKLNVHNLQDEEFAILTPVHINMGQKSYGISPANGELHYTIRTWRRATMANLKSQLESLFERICRENRLAFEVKWFEYFPASENDPDCNDYITQAAKLNGLTIKENGHPFKFGEDFGWFSHAYKTGMFGLGAGSNAPALHYANYDFPDEIIDTGMNMFKTIISTIIQGR